MLHLEPFGSIAALIQQRATSPQVPLVALQEHCSVPVLRARDKRRGFDAFLEHERGVEMLFGSVPATQSGRKHPKVAVDRTQAREQVRAYDEMTRVWLERAVQHFSACCVL